MGASQTAVGANTASIAVAGGCNGLGIAVAALGAGVGLNTGLGAGGCGGGFGGIAVAAGLVAGLILKQHQLGHIAAGGRSIGAELADGGAVVNTTSVVRRGQHKAAVAGGDGPGIGAVCQLEVGAGVVGHIHTVHAQGNTAADDADFPHRQVGTGHPIAGNRHIHTGELAAGQRGAHSLVAAVDLSHDDILTGGDGRAGGHLHEGRIGGGSIGTPGAAAVVPAGHSIAVVTVGRQGQVGSLIPFIVPVVCAIGGVHAAENHRSVAAGDLHLVNAVPIGIGAIHPHLTVAVKICGKAGIVRQPFAVGLQVDYAWCGSKGHHGEHTDDHADYQHHAQ